MNKRILKIINNSQAVIFYWQAKEGWPVEFVSENIEMFGYTSEDFLTGRVSYASIIHPDDAERVGEEVVNYTETGQDKFRQVYRILDATGATRWVDDRTVIERNAAGEPEYYLGTIIDVGDQKEAEHYSFLLGNVVNQSTDQVYIFNSHNYKFTYLNKAALEHLGCSMLEALALRPDMIKQDMDLKELKSLLKPFKSNVSPQNKVTFETTHFHPDGSIFPVEVNIQLLEIEGLLQYVAVLRDISERRALQAERESQHAFVQRVLDGLADEVMVIHADYSLEWMNQSTKVKLNPEFVADLDNPKCYEVSHHRSTPCDGSDHPCPLRQVMKSKQSVSVIHNHGHDGQDKFVELVAKPLKNAQGEVYAVVESVHDITSLIQAQEALREQADTMSFQASHDGLTGLPNRRLYQDRLDQAIARALRLSSIMSVVFIDIDKFKDINDQLGHQSGDEVLVEVAKRLKTCLRASDTVARLGGDEFTLLLEGVNNKAELSVVMTKIMQAFEVPIETCAGPVMVSISAGLASFPEDATDRKTLIRNADLALYDVKVNGRRSFKFHDELNNV